jgi:AMMECR1 domain-containing protein
MRVCLTILVVAAAASPAFAQPVGPVARPASRPATQPASAMSPATPLPPEMTHEDGEFLVRVARLAMDRYLATRQPAERQEIPHGTMAPAARRYAAAVTLRGGGKVLGRGSCGGMILPRNVMAAALVAMRSPDLPDRVDPGVLAGLTVEVEVAGEPVEVAVESPASQDETQPADMERKQAAVRSDIARSVRPGVTGLRLAWGPKSAWVLPSTAYEEKLDAGQVRARCLEEISRDPPSAAPAAHWSVFATMQFVGYPDGTVVRMFRGKAASQPASSSQPAAD